MRMDTGPVEPAEVPRDPAGEPSMRVVFVGEPDNGIRPSSHNAAALAAIGVETRFDQDWGWRSGRWTELCRWADVLHLVTYSQCNAMLLRKLWRARARGLAIVRYWVGTDVLWARFHEPSRRFARALEHLGVLNLAVADHLVEELAEAGITAEATPVITPHISATTEPHPLPKELTVLCYLPTRRRTFYGGPVIDRLIAELPDVRFIVLADRGTDYSRFPSVESLGFVDDLERTIGRCTVHVRPTAHDGMPRLVLEMLARGRHAVTPHPYAHCRQATDVEAMKRVLLQLRRSAEFNLAGREYVCERFETPRAAAELCGRIDRSREPAGPACRCRGRRQAAQLLARCPWLLSRRIDPLPAPEDLPPEAEALRLSLIGDRTAERVCQEVPAE